MKVSKHNYGVAGLSDSDTTQLVICDLQEVGFDTWDGPWAAEQSRRGILKSIATTVGYLTFADGQVVLAARQWAYWHVSMKTALSYESALRLDNDWHAIVRAHKMAGGSTPIGPVGTYHVDSMDGFKALYAAIIEQHGQPDRPASLEQVSAYLYGTGFPYSRNSALLLRSPEYDYSTDLATIERTRTRVLDANSKIDLLG